MDDAALAKLDAYLCDLKEMQIRDGLHIFGKARRDRLLTDLAAALARVPRGRRGQGAMRACKGRIARRSRGRGSGPSIRSIAICPGRGDPGPGVRRPDGCPASGRRTIRGGPMAIRSSGSNSWRRACRGARPNARATDGRATRAVLEQDRNSAEAGGQACGPSGDRRLLAALDGRFVAPGPSGRADARAARRAADGAELLFGRQPRRADAETAWELGRRSANCS
jgi:cobaltochelatase CobN